MVSETYVILECGDLHHGGSCACSGNFEFGSNFVVEARNACTNVEDRFVKGLF